MTWMITVISSLLAFIFGLLYHRRMESQQQVNALSQLQDEYEKIDSQDDTCSDVNVFHQ